MTLRIGELARRTRTNPPTIRYYEEIGLLPPPERRDGGQRCYGSEDLRRLTFIRQCREFGLPIERIRSLVELTRDSGRSCLEARAIAVDHLETVREKLVELQHLERNLVEFIERCDADCAGRTGPDCAILQEMAEPSGRHSR